MHAMAVSLLGPSGMSNRAPHFPHAQKENAGTLHYRSGLQFNKAANVSIDGPNRGHGNHHGRVAASCIARVRVADVEIIAAPRPGRRSRQFAVATLACWLIAQLPPADSLAALVVWFEIGVWRTLGGPTPADDVDLTLMIREGQTGQVNDHRIVRGRACHADPVVRGPELLMRSGMSAGVCTTPWEPWRGGPHLDWRRPPSRGDVSHGTSVRNSDGQAR